ncbi:hypothetical protein GDO81_014176 [Engystomops pustulosus]|uniref:Olfactory receptor n=1 Tax=Engystomops pustulosus TaxID=76066 RepID=A0AAV7B8S9_ENGPU|nr:hypothetical protein GDO81_014176 [Engystomops pustulosus]
MSPLGPALTDPRDRCILLSGPAHDAITLLPFPSYTVRAGPFCLRATRNNCQAYLYAWQLFWGVMAPHHASMTRGEALMRSLLGTMTIHCTHRFIGSIESANICAGR